MRLPSAPRERKPALAALAVLLILVGALGATVLVLRAGDRIEVVKITEKVSAGKPIPTSAMKPVMVAEDTGIDYVKWKQRNALSSYRATADIVGGSLLVGPMLTDKKGLPEGKVVVGLSLKDGQYPRGLKTGDVVAAYRVGDVKSNSAGSTGDSDASSGDRGLLVRNATVDSVTSANDGSGGDLPVAVVVNQDEAPALTQSAANGEVSVVKVSGTDSGN
ncbi:hypothetical protein FHS42_001741 [Streptomyces zagrosensis]|uniref:SAF domain-containing protein n=1 Tax=Streptomyces zagrosensis TaxID=1042984 RepID=A0A7W9UYD6_9ACTN|nr:hypothetical protein [Streptomyces zagrosensis]